MSEAIRAALAGDAALAALLPGGIYTYAQTGRNGISRATLPAAYGADGFLQPCAVVRARESRQADALRDAAAGRQQTVEVYLYVDGDSDSGYSAITAARDQVVALLDRRWLADAGYLRHSGGADDDRDPKLNNAALVRVDFVVTT